MWLSTIGPVSPEQFDAAVSEAAAKAAGAPKLVIFYPPFGMDLAKPLASLARLGCPVIGATTGGAAFTERGPARSELVAGLLGGDDLEVRISAARGLRAGGAAALQEALGKLALKGGGQPAVLTLADPFAVDGEALVAALREASSTTCRHIGGSAGDAWTFTGPKLILDGEVFSDAALFVGLFTPKPLYLAVRHGWSAAQSGRPMTVTDSEGGVLRKLDGRPAAEVYAEELCRLGLMKEGDDLIRTAALNQLGLETTFGEQLKIRAALGAAPDGSLTLAGSLPPKSVLRVVTTTPERLIDAARGLADKTLNRVPFDPCGALVFDCAARLQLLGDRYGEEVSAFQGRRPAPMLGFAGYGEIAKFVGSVDGFHNSTAVMAAW